MLLGSFESYLKNFQKGRKYYEKLDLIRIKAGDVRQKKTRDDLIIKEQKTGKERRVTLNEAVIGTMKALLDSTPYGVTMTHYLSLRRETKRFLFQALTA